MSTVMSMCIMKISHLGKNSDVGNQWCNIKYLVDSKVAGFFCCSHLSFQPTNIQFLLIKNQKLLEKQFACQIYAYLISKRGQLLVISICIMKISHLGKNPDVGNQWCNIKYFVDSKVDDFFVVAIYHFTPHTFNF